MHRIVLAESRSLMNKEYWMISIWEPNFFNSTVHPSVSLHDEYFYLNDSDFKCLMQ